GMGQRVAVGELRPARESEQEEAARIGSAGGGDFVDDGVQREIGPAARGIAPHPLIAGIPIPREEGRDQGYHALFRKWCEERRVLLDVARNPMHGDEEGRAPPCATRHMEEVLLLRILPESAAHDLPSWHCDVRTGAESPRTTVEVGDHPQGTCPSRR